MWYAQKDYQDKQGINGVYSIASIGCFLTSFCNLLNRYGKNISPPDLNRLFIQRRIYIDVDDGVVDDLGWQSITAYDGSIVVNKTASGGWPNTNNAIVKYHYQSVQQPWKTDRNGNRVANMIDHFCLVADEVAHTIIDSWDGQVKKSPANYGEPVGYATYSVINAQPVNTPLPVPVPAGSDGKTYVFVKGDTVWEVARRFGFTAAELMEHNGIADARTVPVGYVMHFPLQVAAITPAEDPIKYEELPQKTIFHVKKPGGCNKWLFGNIKDWKDFTASGSLPENANVEIVAIAHVKVGSDVAAYYMDANAYDMANHRSIATVGINWADLDQGEYIPPAPADPAPAPVPEEPQAAPAEPETPPEDTPTDPETKQPEAGNVKSPVVGTLMFRPFKNASGQQVLKTLFAIEQVSVKEMRSKAAPKTLLAGQQLDYCGEVVGADGETYYIAYAGYKNGYYYGVDRNNLENEDAFIARTAAGVSTAIDSKPAPGKSTVKETLIAIAGVVFKQALAVFSKLKRNKKA